ncbi:hypothetical protein ACLB1G_25830 [Oxalobacteraceae bacterium A2-2]
MKWTSLMAAGAVFVSTLAQAAPPADPKATHDLLAAMQIEKMLRYKAGSSRYATPQQRQAVMDKVLALPAEQVYTRLTPAVSKLVDTETATEITRYYQSSYGQKVLKQTYNSGPALYETAPKPTAAEAAELRRPAYVKADKAFKAVEPAIEHEVFVLLTTLNK